MAKKNKKSKKQSPNQEGKAVAKKPLVTMADLQAMSDSEDDSALPPEEEWDNDAKALKKAIEDGAFDRVMEEYQKGDDTDSIEEVELDEDDSSAGEEEVEQKKNDQKRDVERDEYKNENSSEEEESSETEEDEEEEGVNAVEGGPGDNEVVDSEEEDEEEKSSDDESESKAKIPSDPQHKKESISAEKNVEDAENDKGSDSDSENEDGSDEDGEKRAVSNEDINTKAIRVVTEDLAAVRNSMPWAESFTIVPETTSPFAPGVESPLDIHDDLKREVAFYDLALEAALEARKKCEEAKIPFSRPEDFFAEMVKTDGKNT